MAIDVANLTVCDNAAVTISTDLGSIEKNTLVITPSQEILDPQVEQHLAPRKRFRISEGAEIAFTLLEPTLARIKILWDTDNPVTTVPEALIWGDDQQGVTSQSIVVTAREPTSGDVRTITCGTCTVSTPAPYNISDQDVSRLPVVFSSLGVGAAGMIAFSDA